MINLLPPDIKSNILFARRNHRLRRWIVSLTFGLIGIAVIVAFGVFYINQSTDSYSAQVQRTEQDLANQKLPEIQKQVEDISSSLKLVVQVLQREILFSKLFRQVGSAIPPNSSLNSLSISKVSGGIDLTAVAADYATATQVQVNLQDPANKIFDKADIVNISCSATSADPRYPCTVAIRAQFAKNNPFLFISPTASGSTSP